MQDPNDDLNLRDKKMTLSEAINNADKNALKFETRAEEILRHGPAATGLSLEQANLYLQYAREQRQIKEWLRELQRFRWMSQMDTD